MVQNHEAENETNKQRKGENNIDQPHNFNFVSVVEKINYGYLDYRISLRTGCALHAIWTEHLTCSC